MYTCLNTLFIISFLLSHLHLPPTSPWPCPPSSSIAPPPSLSQLSFSTTFSYLKTSRLPSFFFLIPTTSTLSPPYHRSSIPFLLHGPNTLHHCSRLHLHHLPPCVHHPPPNTHSPRPSTHLHSHGPSPPPKAHKPTLHKPCSHPQAH